MPLIYKIVYRSYATATSDAEREADVAGILGAAEDWNVLNGITGALLLSRTGYAQVIEGPPQAVKSLFGHIACDRRHRAVELLYNDYETERDFGNWSMAVVGPPEEGDIELASTGHAKATALSDHAEEIRRILRWLLIDGPLRKAPR